MSDRSAIAMPPPVSAGGETYLGHYGIVGNAWAAWLLARESTLLAARPSDLAQSDDAPPCPGPAAASPWLRCKGRMVLRAEGWKCYQHAEPVLVKPQLAIPAAPAGDVLGRTGEALDYVWDVDEGRYAIGIMKLPNASAVLKLRELESLA